VSSDPAKAIAADSCEQSPQGQYWSFFWPLVLTGLAMVLARQFQHGALGRFARPTEELAIFVYAWSSFHLFNAPIIFLPQMINVLARSRRARRKCLSFALSVAAILTVPVLVLAFTPVGRLVLPAVFPIDEATTTSVVMYLRYLSPLILIHGSRQYATGLLVQSRRTGLVTILQVYALAAMFGMLIVGLRAGWPAYQTLGVAQVASAATAMVATFILERKFRRAPVQVASEELTYRRILAFFLPVALTSVMFSLSRPILFAFAGRGDDGEATVAALGVAGGVAMLFQNCLNQFRHLFVTFGRRDLPGIRRFLIRVWFVVTVLMVSIAATPVGTWLFRDLLGVEPHVLPMARHVLGVMCLAPLMICIRNYFHGIAMTGRSTLGMAVGGVCRVLALGAGAAGLYHLGWLNHVTAAAMLVAGFAVEALMVIATLLIQRRADSSRRHPIHTRGPTNE